MHRVKPRSFVLPAAGLLALIALAVWSNSADGQVPAADGTTVFEGARLITGDGRAPIENAAFVVSAGRFVAVGRVGQVRLPAGATHVNLAGKTVMPAIIDTHTHLSTTRDALITDLRRRAYYGIGAAMSLGTDPGELPFQIRALALPGAALYRTAGRGITMPEPGRSDIPYWVTTEAEARKAVRELAANKVDIVKIWVDDRNGMYKKLTEEFYTAVIDEAHKSGLRVTAHIFALEDAKGLLKAGIDAFAHGVRDKDIDADGLALFKAHPNVVVVPNLPDRGVVSDLSWLSESVPAAELEELQAAATNRPEVQAAYGIQARNLAKLNAAGVHIALGTDGNTPWGPHAEMADMVAAGMTPTQVLVAATRTSAEFMRLTDAGTVAAGKSADFIVLNANPLDDITNTRRIASVYLRGAAVDRAPFRVTQTAQANPTPQAPRPPQPLTAAMLTAPIFDYDIVKTYPHATDALTQGLLYLDGFLYEGTGERGRSRLMKIDLETGKVLQETPVDPQYQGEGVAEYRGQLFQLTLRAGFGFLYDRNTFAPRGMFTYSPMPIQMWGIEFDGSRLILSGPTSTLRFFDPATMIETGSVVVKDGAREIARVDELENIKGELWANIYQTDKIAVINPATGAVKRWIDLAGIAAPDGRYIPPQDGSTPDWVLNGIAYDRAGDRLFVTGKNWPKIYEIKLRPRSQTSR